MQIARLLRTVRHLRPIQIGGQLRQRARRVYERPERLLDQPVEVWPGVRWSPRAHWLAPGAQGNTADTVQAGRLTFLNDEREVRFPPRWDVEAPKLWQYNLHYMEYLWALDFDAAREVVDDWIAEHTPARGRVGWEPYPISLRLMNWCALFFGRWQAQTLADEAFRDRLWASVQRQADWLAVHLETHLMGNHLLENAISLAFVGACFHGDAAARWQKVGMSVLEQELAEQILSDGGHFERSPMYQARLVYAMLLLLNTGDDEVSARTAPVAEGMLQALVDLTHPDGGIALLNDAALGIYNTTGELVNYAQVLMSDRSSQSAGGFALLACGYYGSRTSEGHYVVCDAGRIGPDYIPGHAHADIFSFELSFAGHRLIVDAGTYDYVPSQMRAYCRSTAAHNTVTVDGQDQSEMWGAFRVGRRARPHDVKWQEQEGGFSLQGWHGGYRHLSGRPVHHRRFRWYDAGVLLVRDEVEAAGETRVSSRLHLHPDVRVTIDGSNAHLQTGAGPVTVAFAGEGRLTKEQGWYCPEFGQRLESPVLTFASTGVGGASGFCIVVGAKRVTLDLERGAEIDDQQWGW